MQSLKDLTPSFVHSHLPLLFFLCEVWCLAGWCKCRFDRPCCGFGHRIGNWRLLLPADRVLHVFRGRERGPDRNAVDTCSVGRPDGVRGADADRGLLSVRDRGRGSGRGGDSCQLNVLNNLREGLGRVTGPF